MKRLSAALALALNLGAYAQSELPLELGPLMPASPPAQAQKKARRKKAKKPAETQAAPKAQEPAAKQPAADAQSLPLPPLVAPPAPEPPPLVRLATIGVSATPDSRVAQGLKAIAQNAPLTRAVVIVDAPAQPCADAGCLAQLATAAKVDTLLVAAVTKEAVRVRTFDLVTKKERVAEQAAASGEEVAVAESLACQLLVPTGCTGELAIAASAGVELKVDGAPVAARVPVGVRVVEARAGAKSTRRQVPVVAESPTRLTVDANLNILTPGERAPSAPAEALVATSARQSPWVKRSGYAALGVGAAVAAVAIGFGVKSHSDLNSAESSYQKNGAYRAADVAALNSGNSAAKTANTLFVASAACLAAGALLTFAF